MPSLEVAEQLKELTSTLASVESVLDVPRLEVEVTELEKQASAPDLWDDQERAQAVTSRLSFIQGEIRKALALRQRVDDLPIMFELAEVEGDDDMLGEAGAELESVAREVAEMEVRTLLSGEYDSREALMTIRSEAGGVDAADWAEMLMRMYTRYCERHGWPVQVYDISYAEEAGIKSATFAIKAPYAYGTLSVEQGTHRLVRISPFDNQGRRQTSFAGVEVIPVVEQTDHIEIPEDEIRGVRITKQGKSRVAEVLHKRVDPNERTYYWLSGELVEVEDTKESDLSVIKKNMVSITPLHYDLTDYEFMKKLSGWKIEK